MLAAGYKAMPTVPTFDCATPEVLLQQLLAQLEAATTYAQLWSAADAARSRLRATLDGPALLNAGLAKVLAFCGGASVHAAVVQLWCD